MILKSIKLKNFRQFIDAEIHFSTDKKKNVTFVMANNSTGKTTIANAFTWCLFGFHYLPDPYLLNKKIEKGLNTRGTENVEVEIELRYGEQDYTIRRTQVQQLNSTLYGKAKLDIRGTMLEMTYKDSESGVTRIIDPDKVQDRINLIIPQDLASYFFIRAEQMTSMADATQQGKLNNNLADAVEKILGMQAIKNAVKHLTGQQNSACALLQKELNNSADAQMEKAINESEECKNKVDRNKKLIKDEEDQIKSLIERNTFLTSKIKEEADGEKVQTELEERDNELKRMNAVISGSKSEFFKKFALDLPKFCYKDLISDVIKILQTTEITDKHVPKVTRETIEFLLKRGECICGQTLKDNNDHYRALIKLIDYVPPVSIGSTVAAYVEGAKAKYPLKIYLI